MEYQIPNVVEKADQERFVIAELCIECGNIFLLCRDTENNRAGITRSKGKNGKHTLICPDFGTRDALEAIGISAEKQEEILEIIHEKLGERGA